MPEAQPPAQPPAQAPASTTPPGPARPDAPQPDAPRPDAPQIAARLRNLRRDTLHCAAQLSETRVYARTDRDGWTLKHELAYLAAADRVLLALIEALRSPGDAPITLAQDPAAVRRLHGQAMHITQELRLDPLRETLAATGEATAAAIEQHAHLLHRPAALGSAPTPAIHHLQQHLHRAHQALDRLRAATL